MIFLYEKLCLILTFTVNSLLEEKLNDISNYWEYLVKYPKDLQIHQELQDFIFSDVVLEKIKNSKIIGDLNTYSGYWTEQYSYILLYIIASIGLALVLLTVSFLASSKDMSFEKSSSYECGFEPFGNAHSVFNIQFFVVGILFMIFDLELAYLFPWSLYLGNLTIFSFYVMMVFLIILVIGFIYEWKKGALDWV